MNKITIYTTGFCSYCLAAKALLQKKGLVYEEIDVSYDAAARQRMAERAHGRRTVPQIFIGDRHVGGYRELVALDGQGRLEPAFADA